MMVKLFYAPGTCALAPHIVLEWIGQPYELERVKLGDPDYARINPQGKVPAMLDGFGLMTQADAILKYLAHKHPEANLGHNGSLQEEYELNRWLAFFTGDVHPAFYPFFRPGRYFPDENEAALQQVKTAAYKLIDTVFTHLDQHLQDREYVVGDRFTIVEPYAFAMLRWGKLVPKPLSDYPHLSRFYDRMLQDEGVQRAMSQEGVKG